MCGAHFRLTRKVIVKRSTIINNIALLRLCIIFQNGLNDVLQYSNIVNNSESHPHITSVGIVFSLNSNTAVETCIFFNNSPILFGKENGNLDVFRCFLDPDYSVIGIHIFNNKGITSSYKLSHFNSESCEFNNEIENKK